MIERRDPLFADLCRALKKLRDTILAQAIIFLPPMSVAAMQNFRGIRVMGLKGTGLVDKHGLADALRGMDQSEREIQQLLDSVSVNVVTPTVGPKVTVPNLRKTHDLPVLRESRFS